MKGKFESDIKKKVKSVFRLKKKNKTASDTKIIIESSLVNEATSDNIEKDFSFYTSNKKVQKSDFSDVTEFSGSEGISYLSTEEISHSNKFENVFYIQRKLGNLVMQEEQSEESYNELHDCTKLKSINHLASTMRNKASEVTDSSRDKMVFNSFLVQDNQHDKAADIFDNFDKLVTKVRIAAQFKPKNMHVIDETNFQPAESYIWNAQNIDDVKNVNKAMPQSFDNRGEKAYSSDVISGLFDHWNAPLPFMQVAESKNLAGEMPEGTD